MIKKALSKEELQELKGYIKKQAKKLRQEGSTTSATPGYLTPAAFTGKEGGDGTEAIDLEDDQYGYSIKAKKTNRNFIKIHEASYQSFKEDPNTTEIQKVNNKILEVNKMLGEISRALDHSLKLKQESALDNSTYWKRTSEAILRINRRLSEVKKKANKLANLKELAEASIKDKLHKLLKKADIGVSLQDIESNKIDDDYYEFDIMIGGEPYAIDYDNGDLIYQGLDDSISLGNIKQEQAVIQNLIKIFKQ